MNSNQQYVDQNYVNTAQPSMQAQTMAQPNMQPQGMEKASMAQPSMAQPSMQAQSMEQVSMQTQTTAQPGIENNVEQTKKPTSVFVTVTRYPEKDQTFVGFGSLTPHEKNKEIAEVIQNKLGEDIATQREYSEIKGILKITTSVC